MMGRISKAAFAALVLGLFVFGALARGGSYDEAYDKYVGPDGGISLPSDYRTSLVFVGTFGIAGGDQEGGQAEFHHVYMDRDSIAHYRRTGTFPDGAIIVKELQKTRALDMTTGRASSRKEDAGWFVMIKDTKGRFPEHGAWGDGWGWALFDPSDRTRSTTRDFKAECTGCHLPAQSTDWVHVWAYPLLDAGERFADFNQ